MKHLKYTTKWVTVYIVFICCSFQQYAFSQPSQPNIILITLDDCNDYLKGFDVSSQVKTPNISALANSGTLFYNAYCSSPKCAPSRTSFYMGKDPYYTGVYHNWDIKCNSTIGENMALNGVSTYYTLPQVLKDSGGYFTYSISKNMHCFQHGFGYDSETADACSKGESWNRVVNFNDGVKGSDQPEILLYGSSVNVGVSEYKFAAIPDSMESQMQDYLATDSAIAFLEEYDTNSAIACSKPFFMAIGYRKPHDPLYIPGKYFPKAYDINYEAPDFNITYDSLPEVLPNKELILPPQPEELWSDFYALPNDGVAWALVKENYIHEGIFATVDNMIADGILPEFEPGLSADQRRIMLLRSFRANMIMAYIAAIQFVDAQVGRLMAALDAHPGIKENTIVVLISDHGYSLGEKSHWKKGALWETDIRTPLIIVDFRNPEKQRCMRNVSLLDLFPTLVEMTGTPVPLMPDGSPYLDGYSLVPLLENPKLSWERPVLTSYRNGKDPNDEGSCFPAYSVRSSEWHYIQYHSNGGDGYCDSANSQIEEELYHIGKKRQIDPFEWNNLADNADYDNIKNKLKKYLPGNPLYMEFAREAIEMPAAGDTMQVSIAVSPNPASNYIEVITQGLNETLPYEISVTGLKGVLLQRTEFDSPGIATTRDIIALGVEKISSGIYIVCVRQGGFSYYEKLVVIR